MVNITNLHVEVDMSWVMNPNDVKLGEVIK